MKSNGSACGTSANMPQIVHSRDGIASAAVGSRQSLGCRRAVRFGPSGLNNARHEPESDRGSRKVAGRAIADSLSPVPEAKKRQAR